MNKYVSKLRKKFLSYSFYIVLLLLVVFSSIIAPSFLTSKNILALIHGASPLMITACGMAFVIMSAKIDLSIGSIALFSTYVSTLLIVRYNWPIGFGIILMLFLGCVLGAINGFFIVVMKINPLITTLGTLFAFRGAALYITDSRIIGMPEQLRKLGIATVGPIFITTIIAFVVLIIMHIIQTRTGFGKSIFAIGNSEITAKNLGVKVNQVTFISYVLAGFFASFGGLFTVSQVGSVNPSIGSGLEFTAIAVIVIGGISLSGGEGKILPDIVVGILTLSIIENVLNLLGVSPFAYPFIKGVTILLAMYGDSLKLKVRNIPQRENLDLH